MIKKKESFVGLGSILDIIYGALIAFVIITLGDKYFSTPEGSFHLTSKFLALVLLGIFMFEDYCNLKMLNKDFIYFIGTIHLLRSFWAIFLLNRNKFEKKYRDFLRLVL